MRGCFIFLLGIVLLSSVYAICDSGQIDINNASLKELEGIIGVGPATAQKIVDVRPFNSIDDLTRVSGIGEIKLANIKEQNLACVKEKGNYSNEEEKIEGEEKEITYEENTLFEKIGSVENYSEGSKNEKIIRVNRPKDIKSENNKEILYKNKYAILGFFLFCLLVLFLIRSIKLRKNVLR
jgi:competence ComEA-like helix-hairpin-helix protein